MQRREFLTGCGLVLLGTRVSRAQTAPRTAAQLTDAQKNAKLARIGVLSWSLNQLWSRNPPAGMPPWDFLNYPELIADRYGLHNIEVQDENFASTEESYINEFIARMKKTKSRMINICLEVDRTCRIRIHRSGSNRSNTRRSGWTTRSGSARRR